MNTHIPPPVLVIDWGDQLRVERQLIPTFDLLCPGWHGRPYVAVQFDETVSPSHWKTEPRVEPNGEFHWVFRQVLRLTAADGVREGDWHALAVRVVFPGPEGQRADCFKGEVRIQVPDAQGRPERTVVIKAGGAGLVNIQANDVLEATRIYIEAEDQSLVNIQEMFRELAERPQDPAAAHRRWMLPFALSEDQDLRQETPFCRSARGAAAGVARSGGTPEPQPPLGKPAARHYGSAAAMVFAGGPRVLLLAKSKVKFGRQYELKIGEPPHESVRKMSDVVLRVWPSDPGFYKLLNSLVSRRQFSLAWTPAGLQIEDHSRHGTFLDNERLSGKQLLECPDDVRCMRLDVAGVMGLELSLHRDPAWSHWAGLPRIAEALYGHVVQASIGSSQAWRDAVGTGIDAARLRRVGDLPLRPYCDRLVRALSREEQQEFRRAACDNLVDAASDEEQYVLVSRSATLGSDDGDAICIARPGQIAARHARILYLDGSFWLEHLDSHQATWIDGEPVSAHELVPLAPGMALQFGAAAATFAEFEQTVL